MSLRILYFVFFFFFCFGKFTIVHVHHTEIHSSLLLYAPWSETDNAHTYIYIWNNTNENKMLNAFSSIITFHTFVNSIILASFFNFICCLFMFLLLHDLFFFSSLLLLVFVSFYYLIHQSQILTSFGLYFSVAISISLCLLVKKFLPYWVCLTTSFTSSTIRMKRKWSIPHLLWANNRLKVVKITATAVETHKILFQPKRRRKWKAAHKRESVSYAYIINCFKNVHTRNCMMPWIFS